MKLRMIMQYISLFLILLSVCLGLNYRSKIPEFYPSDENLKEFLVSTSLAEYELSEQGMPTVESLREESTVIAIVKPTGIRDLSKGGHFVSQAVVEEIMHGKELVKNNQLIYIYENNRLNYFLWEDAPTTIDLNNNSISITGATNILQRDKQYLVFLKQLDMPSYYKFTDEESASFMYANKNFGQFPLEIISYMIITKEDDYKYNNVMNYDCIVPSEDYYQKYKSIYEEISNEFEVLRGS